MPKFNTIDKRAPRNAGPIRTEATPSGTTFEGAPGYAHDLKSELFLLAVSNMVGEDTFYEKAADRDNRYAELVHQAAVADPEWTVGFLRWLRLGGNMRSASLVGAAEFVKARLAHAPASQDGWNRQAIDVVLQRADEPGELLAYWLGKYGRQLPKPLKRGVADGVRRLYTEYNLLKYDTASHAVRFGDVLDLVHPSPAADKPWQGELFKYALERRHGRDVPREFLKRGLKMIAHNIALRGVVADEPYALLVADVLKQAGMTWEDALSLAGTRLDKAKLWSALIPSMGYMALLRNLRNFDEAGVSDETAAAVAARLADPDQVAKSRQFPFRFLAAYENAPSLRWGHALDQALQASLGNLPTLPGRSLILIDTSASMTGMALSARSKMTPAKAAAVFGVALAAKQHGDVDLVGFADGTFTHQVARGGSVLKEVARFTARTGEVGHGTNMIGSLVQRFAGHQRVFIISDMQTMAGPGGVSGAIPANVPLYGFNLGGYQHTAYASGGTRHEFGGLTDATFRMVPLIEAGRSGNWPWLQG